MSFLLVLSILSFSIGCSAYQNCDFVLENTSYSYASEHALDIAALSPYNDDYLNRLKAKYHLEDLVSNTDSDFEKVQTIAKWVTGLWEHDGWNTPTKNDPLSILDEVTENGQQFRCVEYGTVIYGCLTALGVPARILGLKTEDVETREYGAGHVVAEIYLKDLNKWIFVDGQWGMIPILNNTPLDGVEFAQALKEKDALADSLDVINLLPERNDDKEQYFQWIEEYLYFFDFTYWQRDTNENLSGKSIMLTPIDAEDPKVFQINYTLGIDTYTHSVVDFYPVVNK